MSQATQANAGAAGTNMKVVCLGSGGVGKSALTVRFVQGVFVKTYDPTIEDSYRKIIDTPIGTRILEILDTAGTEQFTAMRDLYMRDGQGFVLVFSLVSRGTFLDLNDIYESIVRIKDTTSFPLVVVGNKCDLEEQRVVTREEAQAMTARFGGHYVETSAKLSTNVDTVFEKLIEKIIIARKKTTVEPKKKGMAHAPRCAIL